MTHEPGNESSDLRAAYAPDCRLVADSARYSRKVVRDLRFDGDLTIAIQGTGFSYAHVVFRQPVGFRVMDEMDITEYWNTYSEPHGWLWEVVSGGWLDLERRRPTFWRAHEDGIREFFLVDDQCVNVLCWDTPEIIDLGTDPTAAK
ncbi:hypothetical protein FMUBM48_42860 [Nocardia cyriacigeorgica]|uniref:hypothetical protein n=1 Tax=Nocardia cyriacigeorgica TaxID=135487 RepID=UPI0011D19599|nr:hypothetical protein [Nocardia cyriacigeorgica]BDU08023.1 hypothetical protein FMUBM48_42860 [Nocardia cyriacigeorgica]